MASVPKRRKGSKGAHEVGAGTRSLETDKCSLETDDGRPRGYVVTGASRGIGRATAEALLGLGHRVCGIARSLEAFGEIANHERFVPIAFDLAKTSGIPSLVQQVCIALDRIDGFVSCAGIARHDSVTEFRGRDMRATLNINLRAPMVITREIAPHMQPGSSIIFVTSTLAERAAANTGIYAASKAGHEGFARAAAVDLAKVPVRVNCISPGVVDTDMVRGDGGDEAKQRLAALAMLHPLGRLGTPEEIASTIVATIAQTFVTGAVLRVDGGLVAGSPV